MNIAAVFTTCNRSATALRCLECLLAQTSPPAKIVIVDNGSTDGTAADIRRVHASDPRIELIALTGNSGNAGGVRLAMEKALETGVEAIWILDDDSWPLPDALENLLKFYREEDVIGSLVLDPKNGDLTWPCVVGANAQWKVAEHLAALPDGEIFEVRGIWLGMLIPAKIIQIVGLPEAALFIRGEDEEYPMRIRKHGYRFRCVRNSILEHACPTGLTRISCFSVTFFYQRNLPVWKAYYAVRNKAYLHRKFAASWAGGVAKALASTLLSLGMAVFVDDQKLSRVFTYTVAGWRGATGRLKGSLGQTAP